MTLYRSLFLFYFCLLLLVLLSAIKQSKSMLSQISFTSLRCSEWQSYADTSLIHQATFLSRKGHLCLSQFLSSPNPFCLSSKNIARVEWNLPSDNVSFLDTVRPHVLDSWVWVYSVTRRLHFDSCCWSFKSHYISIEELCFGCLRGSQAFTTSHQTHSAHSQT